MDLTAKRIDHLFIIFLAAAGLIAGRFVYLQIWQTGAHVAAFKKSQASANEERGEIFLRDRFMAESHLAINKDFFLVYAEPDKVGDAGRVADSLSKILGVERESVTQKIGKRGDPYEVIAQKVPEETVDRLKELDLPGIKFSSQKWRYYPYGALAAHVAGFVGIKNDEKTGQYGLEGYYEDELSDGFVKKMILSIDPQVQFKTEEKLKEALEKWSSSGGSIIVMEPATGRILGLANYPNYDPNEYPKIKDISIFNNRAVSGQFELGSVFKPITMAMGLEEKAVTPDTVYDDKGVVAIGGWTVENSDGKSRGLQTMTQVLERSLNTGAVFVQQKLPKEKFKSYVRNFGFGRITGVDLAGEVPGDARNLDTDGDIEFANISFGQGIAVTPVQMLSAVSALANDGVLMKPRLVDQQVYFDDRVSSAEPAAVRRVVSSETARALTKMLVSVVENGYDKARVPGYFVAGKTGTAQVPNKNKKGYSEDTIHTFVGYAPAYRPRFSILIKMDQPQGVRFAAESLTPVFSDIMSYLLSYYEVPPDY